MKKDVVVRIEIDPSFQGTQVIIKSGERSSLVEEIVFAVDQCAGIRRPRITVYQGDIKVSIRQQDIIRIYTENRRLVVSTNEGEYSARCTLRELEDALVSESFTRISRFEIVNMTRIQSFDFSLSGTIRIMFDDRSVTYVSRRYVPEIEKKLTQWKM